MGYIQVIDHSLRSIVDIKNRDPLATALGPRFFISTIDL